MRPTRTGLSGKMCSGKNVVADYLTEYYGFHQCSFANRVKILAAELLGMHPQKKDRYLLQQLAQHLRAVDPNIWVRAMLPAIPLDKNVVVTDVRYPNEYDNLKRMGFIIVRMVTSRYEQLRLLQQAAPNMPPILLDDSSETALDTHSFDHYIYNDEHIRLDQVFEQADELMEVLGVERQVD